MARKQKKKRPREKRPREKPESTMFVRLGEYLKRERELKGLTQEQVGEAMGMAGSRISAVENGRGNPEVANLGLWLEALEIGPAAFGWRFEQFCGDQTLTPIQSEAHVEMIVRNTLAKVFQETSGFLRETETRREVEPGREPETATKPEEEKDEQGR